MIKNIYERSFYDFFAGAGLVRLGFEGWDCLWANDIDPKKAEVHTHNFGKENYIIDDIANINTDSIPGYADLAWASFPCQDLSLAGPRVGINGPRSGVFWHFMRILNDLNKEGRLPPVIVIENVLGLLRGGNLEAVCESFAALNLCFGAMVIDGKHFVSQSRPRVFVVAADREVVEASGLMTREVDAFSPWFTKTLITAFERLPEDLKKMWRWWQLPTPLQIRHPLAQIIENEPTNVVWHSPDETKRLLNMMAPPSLLKIEKALSKDQRVIGMIYKRTREGRQRAEVRMDGLAGCLRTPQGGSSRQIVVIIETGQVRSRLLSPREAARLMGVPDSFWLPPNYNDAYKAVGDGVVVPATKWLSKHLLAPLVDTARTMKIYANVEQERGIANVG